MAIFSLSSIVSGVKLLPSLMKNWKTWAIIIGVVGILFAGWYIWTDYQDIRSELATQTEKKEELERDIKEFRTKLDEERELISDLRNRNQMITSNYLDRVKELRDARENKSDIKENPEVGAAKIEGSFNNYMDDMTCITGGGQCRDSEKQD